MSPNSTISQLEDYASSQLRSELIQAAERRFEPFLEENFFIEFTDGDLDQIQQAINELRELLTKSDLFEDEHKQRLLKRLEVVQSELHKKVSDIDKIWGLVGDAGIALGKFGKDAKPFQELITKIGKIGWRAQARAEQLPSDAITPMLENLSSEEE